MATYTPPKGPTDAQLKMNIDSKNYQVKVPSLADVQKEWGLTDPSKYADTIANANAQIKRDAIESQRQQLNQNLREGQMALDVDFFQQFRNQREENAMRGLNSGIEQQRSTQLDMSRQQQLSGILRDNNREQMNLKRDEARIELERTAEQLQIRNTELQRQVDLAFKKGDFLQAEASRRQQLDTQKELQRVENLKWSHGQKVDAYWGNLEQQSRDRSFSLEQQQFGLSQQRLAWEKQSDIWERQFKQSQAANEQARFNAEMNMRQTEAKAQQQAKAQQRVNERNQLVSKLDLGIKNGSVNPQDAFTMLGDALHDGVFDSRDGDYKQAVQELSKTAYDYVYNKKK